MPDSPTWTEDHCTCGHAASDHKDSEGRCGACETNASWSPGSSICPRYQWNGVERKRTW